MLTMDKNIAWACIKHAFTHTSCHASTRRKDR